MVTGHFRHQQNTIIEFWTYHNVILKKTSKNYLIMNFKIWLLGWHFYGMVVRKTSQVTWCILTHYLLDCITVELYRTISSYGHQHPLPSNTPPSLSCHIIVKNSVSKVPFYLLLLFYIIWITFYNFHISRPNFTHSSP